MTSTCADFPLLGVLMILRRAYKIATKDYPMIDRKNAFAVGLKT